MGDNNNNNNNNNSNNEKPRLNHKNYGNLLFFLFNTIFTYGVGTAGWLDTPDNGELSRKYQTIITPKSSAFVIWAVIFTFQGVYTILQLLPTFRSRALVQDGVSYWYMIACFFQVGWSFAFAFEVIPLSLVFMVLLFSSLMALIISQYYVIMADASSTASSSSSSSSSSCSTKNLVEFWFVRFPFYVHGGWITAATALNVNVVVVDSMASAATQLAVGIVSLAVLHAISVWHLFGYARPNYTIPIVLIWANGWIYGELQSPQSLVVDTFDVSVINGVAYAAFTVAMVIMIQVILRVAFVLFNYLRGVSYLQVKEDDGEGGRNNDEV